MFVLCLYTFAVCVSDLLHAASVLEWIEYHLHACDSSFRSAAPERGWFGYRPGSLCNSLGNEGR